MTVPPGKLTAQAIGRTLNAQDFERTAQLIEQIAKTTLMRSELMLAAHKRRVVRSEMMAGKGDCNELD